MGETELKQEYERYRMLMYSGGYDPVSFEEWRGILYQPGLSEVARLRLENERLRAALLELGQAASVMNVMLALHEDYPGMVRGWKTAYRRYMRALRKAEKALEGEEGVGICQS